MQGYDQIVTGALEIAQGLALEKKHTQLDAYHLFWGLLKNPQSWTSKGLKDYKDQVKKKIEALPSASKALPLDQLRPSTSLSTWLTYASSEATQNAKNEVSERELLRFMLKVFPELNIDAKKFEQVFSGEDNQEQEVPGFLIDLSEMAGNGKLDPVIGRHKEIRAVMEILGRRGKNNPVLVGPAGVGKTAIVEGLAEAIYKGQVPDVLQNKTVYSLDLGALMAGTKYRGEFEERLQKLLKFLKSKAGQSILFIDEIHQLVGAGRTDGAMDAANLLKPALARGELNCIGATTEDEYQKYILGDAALARRFRSVVVTVPSPEDSIEILMGIREKFEIHHGIKISDEAISAAVYLSEQYITDKNLPDKAIDLIDEASASLKLSAQGMPQKLIEMEADIRNKSILAKVEKDNAKLLNEVEKLKVEFEKEKEVWEKEVLELKKVQGLKAQLDKLKFDLEEAKRTQNYEQASKLQYSLIPEIQKQLEESSLGWVLSRKNVAEVISRQSGIPLEKILKSEQEKILQLEDFLNSRVFGQEKALSEIAGTMVAAHAGLTEPNRPLGSFLLLGPSGVGKTETAKALAEFLFNSKEHMIRLDMSEYSQKHDVAKLIGAPAGYIGHEDGGILTEAIRRRPYSVVLLDEIEKAHEDFADILLQILDDGRLTDNKGRTVSFRNTIIMMTSNAQDYRKRFRPEVLGRIDGILEYSSLGQNVAHKIIEKLLGSLNERLKDKNLHLDLDPELVNQLIKQGVDETYGARPLKGAFQNLIIRPLSTLLLQGQNKNSKQVTARWEKNHTQFDFH